MRKRSRLAYEGGEKSRTISTSEKPKLDLEELMELIDLWGFEDKGREEIKGVLEKYWKGESPHLFRYYHPDEFSDLRERALRFGFERVESGPLVRSSYRARAHACAVGAPGSPRGGGRIPGEC